MSLQNHNIIAVHITDRAANVSQVQTVLSRYGKIIKTRLGLHDANGTEDNPTGVLILEVLDKPEKNLLVEDLMDIVGVDVKEVVFTH